MPKVSVASLVELLAVKVPLVAVKMSNTTVSISVGPVPAFSVGGGRTRMISGTAGGTDSSVGSEFCPVGASVGIKLIGCTGSGLTKGGVLDPFGPIPFA